jgi:hypothetical protein
MLLRSFVVRYKGIKLRTIDNAITNNINKKQHIAIVGLYFHIESQHFLNDYGKLFRIHSKRRIYFCDNLFLQSIFKLIVKVKAQFLKIKLKILKQHVHEHETTTIQNHSNSKEYPIRIFCI